MSKRLKDQLNGKHHDRLHPKGPQKPKESKDLEATSEFKNGIGFFLAPKHCNPWLQSKVHQQRLKEMEKKNVERFEEMKKENAERFEQMEKKVDGMEKGIKQIVALLTKGQTVEKESEDSFGS